MGSFYLILALVFGLLIAIVALANNEIVTVSYIFGRTEISLIILILGSTFFGVLIMGLFSFFRSIRTAFAFRNLRYENEELQKQVKALKEEKIFLEAELNKAISVPEENQGDESAAAIEQQGENLNPDSDEGEGGESYSAEEDEVNQ